MTSVPTPPKIWSSPRLPKRLNVDPSFPTLIFVPSVVVSKMKSAAERSEMFKPWKMISWFWLSYVMSMRASKPFCDRKKSNWSNELIPHTERSTCSTPSSKSVRIWVWREKLAKAETTYVSTPCPPINVFVPNPPARTSSPSPPSKVSLPPSPFSVSLPPSPLISSPEFVPSNTLSEASPLITAMITAPFFQLNWLYPIKIFAKRNLKLASDSFRE